jgi:Mg2+ and Co2+ transporter CorA
MEDMVATFGVASGAFTETGSVWQADASFKDQSGTATMTKDETTEITKILSEAGKLFRKIDSNTLAMIAGDPTPKELIKTYNNKMVREGQKITNVKKHTAGVIKYVYDKLKADVDKVKREQTKIEKQRKMDLYVDFFRKHSSDLVKIFALQNLLIDAKLLILEKLQSIKGLAKTFMRTSTGYKVTAPEGFVAIDTLKGGAVKLVDRLEFAHQNFNAAKNWSK